MTGGKQLIERIQITLKNDSKFDLLPIYIDVYDNSLSRKWLTALNYLLDNNYHLEKNFCFLGFTESKRNADYILNQINNSIEHINNANIGYTINDNFTFANTTGLGIGVTNVNGPVAEESDLSLDQERMNSLHRYFEDLQGVSGKMSNYYNNADSTTRWHIRQLNLLCHEYESLVLSMRKDVQAPMWKRPSQLMCFLNAPRFVLEEEDFELFGVDTIARPLGGVFVGVNKAVGKHHWEVFKDEGRSIDELTTTVLKGQTEAAGDFDIEWANNPGGFPWMIDELNNFKQWLLDNGFDPEDKSLTIGHPQVGQVDLVDSFGSEDYRTIWRKLGSHLNVVKIQTHDAKCEFDYNWSDSDFIQRQIKVIDRSN